MANNREVVLSTLLVKDDYIFRNRRKYRVLSTQRMNKTGVRILVERKGLNYIFIHDIYDTFRTIPSHKLKEGN